MKLVHSRTLFLVLVILFPVASNGQENSIKVTEEALRIHSQSYVWDGHNDLPWVMREKADSSFDKADIAKSQPQFMTDIPRLKTGGVGAQFWSVYVPAKLGITGGAMTATLEQIEIVREMCKRYPDEFAFCESTADILSARKQGKIASLIGVEGGHSIENSIGNLRRLYGLGARYMTLTHSLTLDWADSATDEAKNNGLTEFGKEVVREMNRLGMLVDLSHVSPKTMRDALQVTKAPVIYSHSSARGLADHPRNVPDSVLPLVKKNRGIIMINFYSGYVVPEGAEYSRKVKDRRTALQAQGLADEEVGKIIKIEFPPSTQPPLGTAETLVDHIDHLVENCGIDYVGLGSDYDGVSYLPKQMEDVSCYPVITQVMLDRGYSPEAIHKVMSGNMLRVMREAEQVAQTLQ